MMRSQVEPGQLCEFITLLLQFLAKLCGRKMYAKAA